MKEEINSVASITSDDERDAVSLFGAEVTQFSQKLSLIHQNHHVFHFYYGIFTFIMWDSSFTTKFYRIRE